MKPPVLPPIHDLGPMTAPVTVVGDTHLAGEAPEVALRFLDFLRGIQSRGGTLVLLGDVFDWWVGRKQALRCAFARSIIEALATLKASGTRLAFVAGNRDYAFDGAEDLDLELWPDVVRTTWGDRIVVLSHGDLLCSSDVSYLRMRAFLRWRPSRIFLATVPHGFQTYLARGLRRLSDRAVIQKERSHVGIDYGLARRWLESYEADVLIAGHVHTGVHHRLDGPPPRDVYVLKDWSRAGNEVVFDGQGIALRTLRPV